MIKVVINADKVYVPCDKDYYTYRDNKEVWDKLASSLKQICSWTLNGDKDIFAFTWNKPIEELQQLLPPTMVISHYATFPDYWYEYCMDHKFIQR